MLSIIFFTWLFFVPGVFCEPDVHLVFQSALSDPRAPFSGRAHGWDVDFKHHQTFRGCAKVVRFSARTFADRDVFQRCVHPYVENSLIEQLFFERLGDEYVALSNVKEHIRPGGSVHIEPSLNSRNVFYDSQTDWCSNIGVDQYLMPTVVLFSERQDVSHFDVARDVMTQIFRAILGQGYEEFQNMTDEAAFEKIYGTLGGNTTVDLVKLKKNVGASTKSLRILFEEGLIVSSSQLGEFIEDLKLELQDACVAHGVQNLWSFVLQNGYMKTQGHTIKNHLEQMGFKNVSIECGQNPFNGRKNSWLISAQKS